MAASLTFLQVIGQAVVDVVGGGVFDDLIIEATPNLADHVWKLWHKTSPDPGQKRADLEAIARIFGAAARNQAEEVVQAFTLAPTELQKALLSYLPLVPSMVRHRCRRPSHPAGTLVPANLPLEGGQDVLGFLPARLPWFDAGAHLGQMGDWELEEFLEFTSFGEIWQASNPRQTSSPAVALHFFLNPEAREYIAREEPRLLDQVLLHARHQGIVPLQKVFAEVDPPCLQYALVEAAPLPALLEEWRATGKTIDPLMVANLIHQLAQAVGSLHHLHPPLVLRHLRPANILVQADSNHYQCFLNRVGQGPWSGQHYPDPQLALFASPQQQKGDPPHPRDDVFALGVLWYQLLSGNFSSGRPGGSHWRRKLADLGMAQNLIEILESCFEDDPTYRPADGQELAQRLGEFLQSTPDKKPTPAESPGRARARRPDVWQLLDSLDKSEAPKTKLLSNSIDLKLVLIPAGQFLMGSPLSEIGRRVSEGPQHEVAITKAFYMGVVPVTQRQFEQVMKANPSFFKPAYGGDPDHPVESVTFEEALAFCKQLSNLPEEKAAGRKYRLPTEAEWEFACRAGTTTLFAFGDSLAGGQANFDAHFPHAAAPALPLQKTSKVGLFPANNFGLHDMHGNVWEWCSDWLTSDFYRHSPKRDPIGPDKGDFRILRGGSWRNQALTCRSAYRNGLAPHLRDKYTGFRVVMEG